MLTAKLDPKILGFWIRYVRESLHWSQDVLAEVSGLHPRTIQRTETGQSINVTTRRVLAKALGYENRDVFEDSVFIKLLTETLAMKQSTAQRDMLEQQLPDYIRVKVVRVVNGETLGHLIGNSKATVFHANDDLSKEAKRVTASFFDYVSDMADVYHDISFSERLVTHDELAKLLKRLENVGAVVYSALRTTRILSENGENKTTVPLTIGYLTVASAKQDIQEMRVPRRISWGYEQHRQV